MAKEKFRRYEFIYLVQPDAEEETRTRVAGRINEILEAAEARILKSEEWGKRKLAYEIQKFNKAYYYYLEFIARPGATHEMERVLGLLDDCVRFQTIKLEENITDDDFDRFPLVGEDVAEEVAETEEEATNG
jgi:small subunit ribosomal protein S6